MYNDTSLLNPELRKDFNRLTSIMLAYNYYIQPESVDEIGEKVVKKYFPFGGMDDHTHINAVKVGIIINNILITYIFKTLNYFITILHNRCKPYFRCSPIQVLQNVFLIWHIN